jgi:AmmeMemoRadiSam system protein A
VNTAAPDLAAALDADVRARLLTLARDAIAEALAGRRARVEPGAWPAALRTPAASFVTLTTMDGRLRGCRGVLEAIRPLPEDVPTNAVASALDDPRFRPVRPDELPALHLSVSVLTPAEPLAAADRDALLAALRPGTDGLVIEAPGHRATFLPKVWESLPAPADFIDALWAKAGLAPGRWPAGLRLARYRSIDFGE